MIVCTAENTDDENTDENTNTNVNTDENTNGNTDENNSDLNISVLENGENENVICGKGNSKEVEDRGEEGIKTSTECHENSNSCNIGKDDVDENIISSRTEKEEKHINNIPKNIPKNVPKKFKFIYSVEFSRLHQQYLTTADSGDVNRLALFLSHNPYHPEGKFEFLCVLVSHSVS